MPTLTDCSIGYRSSMPLVRMASVLDRRLAETLIEILRRHGIDATATLRAGGHVLDLCVREADAARARAVLPFDDVRGLTENVVKPSDWTLDPPDASRP
jgi:hypothetical protein